MVYKPSEIHFSVMLSRMFGTCYGRELATEDAGYLGGSGSSFSL